MTFDEMPRQPVNHNTTMIQSIILKLIFCYAQAHNRAIPELMAVSPPLFCPDLQDQVIASLGNILRSVTDWLDVKSSRGGAKFTRRSFAQKRWKPSFENFHQITILGLASH